jgi:hypothetical protein
VVAGRRLLAAEADQGTQECRDPAGLGSVSDRTTYRLSQLGVGLRSRVALEDPGLRLDHLPECPEADAVAVGERAALTPARRLARLCVRLLQLGDEARLANPGDPKDRDELGRALRGGPRKPLLQGRELTLAPDEGRGMPQEIDPRLRQRADRLPGPDLGDLSHCSDRLCLSVLDRVPRRAERLLADEDAGGRGGRLQARGRADDVAHDYGLPLPVECAERDVRLTGCDGHADLPIVLVEPVPDGEGRAYRALGVVLVCCRNAEQCRGGVAGELLDGPAEALEIGANMGVVGAEDGTDVLGIELHAARREFGEVGEQDGDELPLRARRAGARRGRTAADEAGIVAEDPPLELLQALARFDPELGHERLPHLTVRGKCLRMPPGAVEGEHELSTQVLAERVLRGEQCELGYELAAAPEGEVRVETPLQRREAKLVQPGDFGRDGVLVEDVRKRPPAPKGERSSKHLGATGGLVLERGPRGLSEALEARRVELVEIDPKGVAGRTRLQHGGRGVLRRAGLEDCP